MARKEEILKEQQHFFEKALLDPKVQAVLRWLTKTNGREGTLFERLMLSYDNPEAPRKDRLLFYPLHAVFEHMMVSRDSNMEMAKFKFFQHRPTLRALVNTARSIGAFGLTLPQKFIVPLMVVWNFTQACNLKCVHCYQDACTKPLPDEMDLEQKLRFVDEMADEYIPFLALAGGEPLMGRHFWEVLQRCKERHIHVTVASNGTLLTPETCAKLHDSRRQVRRGERGLRHPGEARRVPGHPRRVAPDRGRDQERRGDAGHAGRPGRLRVEVQRRRGGRHGPDGGGPGLLHVRPFQLHPGGPRRPERPPRPGPGPAGLVLEKLAKWLRPARSAS